MSGKARLTLALVPLVAAAGGALAPAPALAAYTATRSGTTATLTGDAVGNTLQLSISGGLLTHNRNSSGDPGFTSNRDFDTSLTGEQTVAAGAQTIVSVTGGGGADALALDLAGASQPHSLAVVTTQ